MMNIINYISLSIRRLSIINNCAIEIWFTGWENAEARGATGVLRSEQPGLVDWSQRQFYFFKIATCPKIVMLVGL